MAKADAVGRAAARARVALALTLAFGSCSSLHDDSALAPAAPAAFTFFAERYDHNGDGSVSREESGRSGVDFDKLDRNADGQISAADFAKAGRRVRGLAAGTGRALRAAALLTWYFQADAETGQLTRHELRTAFTAYDRDADGRVGRREFEASASRRAAWGSRPTGRWEGLLEVETTDPWERILDGVDRDDDGFLRHRELNAFFDAKRGLGWWELAAETQTLPERAEEGLPAPDFLLATVDGSESIQLSTFTGDRPVALIFGSYT